MDDESLHGKFANPMPEFSEDFANPLDTGGQEPPTKETFSNPLDGDGGADAGEPASTPNQTIADTNQGLSSMFFSFAEEQDQGNVVDHEEEREKRLKEAQEYMENHFIISPEGDFRHKWDLIQMLLLVYVAVAVPYRIGFDHDAKPWEPFFVFDIFVDLYFIIDIALSFRTGVIDKHGELVYMPKRIARSYMRGWFVVDTLGCLPISYIMLFVNGSDSGGSEGKANKVFRILRLFKLLKLLRLARLKRLIARYEEEFYALASGFAMAKIMIAVIWIGHWLACMWYGVGTMEEPGALKPNGDPILPWTTHEFGGAAEDTSRGVRYLTALYWAFQTMTTVGYGDIPANTFYEKWAAVLGMLVGGFTFGLIVGALGEMARKSNPGDSFRNKKIAQVSTYLARRGVTPDLLRRIRMYFQNHYEIASVFSTQEYEDYFTRLPTEYRLELAKEVGYLESAQNPGIFTNVASFGSLDTMSLILVCTKLKTELYLKSASVMTSEDEDGIRITRETICRRGEAAWEMLVFLDGIANVSTAEGEGEKIFLHHDDAQALNHRSQFKGNDYVDEHVALLPTHQLNYRSYNMYATTDVTVALLSGEDVAQLRQERPAIDNHLRPYAAAAKRDETIKQIQKIFIQIDEDGSGSIDESEFIEIMKLMGIDLPDAKISEVFATIDADGGGDIDMVEFTEWWLSQEASDTTIRDDGAVVTNQNEFDLQTLKRDMADLDKMTAGMQSQLARITNLLGSKER